MPYLNRDGVRIHFDLAGNGPVVLCTHGYSLTGHMWQGTAAALADGYRVATWDIRGHGHSDSPGDPAAYSTSLALGDMAAILDTTATGPAVLMGHSLGGYLSLAFHVKHAVRIRALVLVGTGPGYRNPDARATWNQQADNRARLFEQNGLEAFDGVAGHGNRHRSAQGLAFAARGILAQHDGRVIEDLPRIRVPTLIVVGADDTPFHAASEYMEKRIPGSRRVILPDAGHLPNLDQPAAFEQLVRAFVDGLPA